MHNIDGDLNNADWLKSAADIKASGGDIEELAKTHPDLPVVRRHKAKLGKNFSSGGGGGAPVTGLVPFDLPGSADSPANPEPKRRQGKIRNKRKPTDMRDFYSS